MQRSQSFSGYGAIKDSLKQLTNSLGSSLDDLDAESYEKVVTQLRDINRVSSKKPTRRHSIGGLPSRRLDRKRQSVQPPLLSPLEEDKNFSGPLTGQMYQALSTEKIRDDNVFEDSLVETDKDLKDLQDNQVSCSSDKDALEEIGTLVKPESDTHINILSYCVMPEHGAVYNIKQTELVVSKDLKLPSDILSVLVIPTRYYRVFNHSLNSDLSI